MEDFVAVFGGVPHAARKLQDYDARLHSDTWIQRLLGEGISCHYVIGYQFEEHWWTFCFDRREESWEGSNEELWVVEAYDSFGESRRNSFLYEPQLLVWRPAPQEDLASIAAFAEGLRN